MARIIGLVLLVTLLLPVAAETGLELSSCSYRIDFPACVTALRDQSEKQQRRIDLLESRVESLSSLVRSQQGVLDVLMRAHDRASGTR
jgi:hypothetical protein